ncbi:MAG: ISL3 family transposase [Nocardioidaceae bacterium]
MRATTLLRRLLDLPGITVRGFSMQDGRLDVDVALTRRRLQCPLCDHTSRFRYDTRPAPSWWRHLDFGSTTVVRVRADLRRLRCPTHKVVVEAVPFARHRSGFTREFEDLTAFLATKTDKTTITRFLRIDWDTIGRICERVVATDMDHDRLDGLVHVGVDEVSWRKHHNYLTLVTNHTTGKVVWGKAGKDASTLDGFFDELGAQRGAQVEAVSMDMGQAFAKSVRAEGHAPQATICIDPFHAVKLVTDALDVERRKAWNELRNDGDPAAAKKFKGARWALLKNPTDLSDDQAATLRKLKRRGGDVWRAYTLKEAFRAIFAGDLTIDAVTELIDRWISRASRSRLPAFVKTAKTIRKFRDGILAALRLGINNGRAEGLNNVVRLIFRRARGFHSPEAALALVMLTCGPITIRLPHERRKIRTQ